MKKKEVMEKLREFHASMPHEMLSEAYRKVIQDLVKNNPQLKSLKDRHNASAEKES